MNASYMNCSDHCDSHLPKPRAVDQINLKADKTSQRKIAAMKRREEKIKQKQAELEQKREAEKQRLLKEEDDEKKRLEIILSYEMKKKAILPFPIEEFEKILNSYFRKTPRFEKKHYNDRGHFRFEG